MPWTVVKVTWSHPERRGSVHQTWREEIVATRPTVGEAREVTARLNVPANGHYWEIRWDPTAAVPKGAPAP